MAKYTGPVLGVGAVTIKPYPPPSPRDFQILLVRRKYKPFPGRWSIPGGHVDPGEDIYRAATRELLEETGVEAEPKGVIHIHQLFAESSRGPTHYVIIDILMIYKRGLPRASSDALEARFFEYKEALLLELTPSTKSLLNILPEIIDRNCLITVLTTHQK